MLMRSSLLTGVNQLVSTHTVCVFENTVFPTFSTMFEISSHLSNDGLAAGTTHSFCHCLHSQFVEVGLQTSKHVVQLVDLSWRTSCRNAAFPLSHDLKCSTMKNGDEDVGDRSVRM